MNIEDLSNRLTSMEFRVDTLETKLGLMLNIVKEFNQDNVNRFVEFEEKIESLCSRSKDHK